MPNGFHGEKEEWVRISTPIKELDEKLSRFAEENGMKISIDYHNVPSRSLRWGKDIERGIHITLVDEKKMIYRYGVSAFQDRGDDRYWKKSIILQDVSLETIKNDLHKLLTDGKRIVDDWEAEDLEFAIKLK